MKIIDKLDKFPDKIYCGRFGGYDNHCLNSLRTFEEPAMKCIAYINDDICVIKGFYKSTETTRYTLHKKEKIKKVNWFKEDTETWKWSKAIDYHNSVNEVIEAHHEHVADLRKEIDRISLEIHDFYDDCIDK